MIGPSKYDTELTAARLAAEAQGAILIILEGKHGNGFVAQLPDWALSQMPAVLRKVADDMERDVKHQSLVAGVAQEPEKQ